jgi:hypothetical protein
MILNSTRIGNLSKWVKTLKMRRNITKRAKIFENAMKNLRMKWNLWKLDEIQRGDEIISKWDEIIQMILVENRRKLGSSKCAAYIESLWGIPRHSMLGGETTNWSSMKRWSDFAGMSIFHFQIPPKWPAMLSFYWNRRLLFPSSFQIEPPEDSQGSVKRGRREGKGGKLKESNLIWMKI